MIGAFSFYHVVLCPLGMGRPVHSTKYMCLAQYMFTAPEQSVNPRLKLLRLKGGDVKSA